MWFPTAGQVIQMHDEILERSGGEPGILYRGPVEAALERARWGPFVGEGDLADRAALLIRGIAREHPFVDGNKRTAFEVADTFLDRNGYYIGATEDEVTTFMVDMARGERSVRAAARWIRRHMRKD